MAAAADCFIIIELATDLSKRFVRWNNCKGVHFDPLYLTARKVLQETILYHLSTGPRSEALQKYLQELDKGPDSRFYNSRVNPIDFRLRNPLFYPMFMGNVNKFQMLLTSSYIRRALSVNTKDFNNDTVLDVPCNADPVKISIIRLILEKNPISTTALDRLTADQKQDVPAAQKQRDTTKHKWITMTTMITTTHNLLTGALSVTH